DGEQLFRSPARMSTPQPHDRIDQLQVGRVRRRLRATRSITQAERALGGISLEPLVARLRRDPVLRRELGHREEIAFVLSNEIQALLHGRRLAPRHRGTSGVAGAPSLWRIVLPMSLD